MAYVTAVLTGMYHNPDGPGGTPASGTVEIIPNSKYLIDADGNVILTGRVKVDLDEDGAFSAELPATDDPSLEPALGRQYTVVAKLRDVHLPAVTGIELPAGTSVDMADVASLPEVRAALSSWLTQEDFDALSAAVDALPTITVSATAPASPAADDVWIDKS